MSEKIAESLIQQMSAQVQLFISLSLGICGALFLLISQVLLHNRDGEKDFIGLKAFYLWIFTFILEGASLCAGALAMTAITSVTPGIYHLDLSAVANWTDVSYAGSESLEISAMAQLAFFFCGLLTLFFFVMANRSLVREMPVKKIKRGLRLGVVLALLSACALALGAQEPRPRILSDSLIIRAEEKSERLRVSSEARRDLAVTVQSVISRRISTNFLGYEQGPEYLGGLNAVYEGFSVALDRGVSQLAFDSLEFRDASLSSLSVNDAEFEIFYSRVLSKDPILQGKTASEIKEAMLLFSAAMYYSDRQLWNTARRKSYFWPVCRKVSD